MVHLPPISQSVPTVWKLRVAREPPLVPVDFMNRSASGVAGSTLTFPVNTADLSWSRVKTTFLVVVAFAIVDKDSFKPFAVWLQSSVANQVSIQPFFIVCAESVAPQKDTVPSLSPDDIAAPSSL